MINVVYKVNMYKQACLHMWQQMTLAKAPTTNQSFIQCLYLANASDLGFMYVANAFAHITLYTKLIICKL